MREKIAIVGAGISGLTVAFCLNRYYDITIFDSDNRLGGHAHSHSIELNSSTVKVDTGFIVYNETTYPNFSKLLKLLNVKSNNADMSISVTDNNGSFGFPSLNKIFADRRKIFDYDFIKMLYNIVKFNKMSNKILHENDCNISVREFFNVHQYPKNFINKFFIPLAGAIWSSSYERVLNMPILFILRFYYTHGLLTLYNQPQWRSIDNAAESYIKKIISRFNGEIKLSEPVLKINSKFNKIYLESEIQNYKFDYVICALHADDALKLLSNPTLEQKNILGAFEYQDNIVTLHTDKIVMPKNTRAWASWNYYINHDKLSLTYYMNNLQKLNTNTNIFVSVNYKEEIKNLIKTIRYKHPLFTLNTSIAQKKFDKISSEDKIFFCGAYWFNGFHEDGVNSALRVFKYFNKGLNSG
ncbi:MAG: NAD(P)-binding protein [Legionellales bacterium]|nr:NAD(P)-binding protein [Legionellales bacterium]